MQYIDDLWQFIDTVFPYYSPNPNGPVVVVARPISQPHLFPHLPTYYETSRVQTVRHTDRCAPGDKISGIYSPLHPYGKRRENQDRCSQDEHSNGDDDIEEPSRKLLNAPCLKPSENISQLGRNRPKLSFPVLRSIKVIGSITSMPLRRQSRNSWIGKFLRLSSTATTISSTFSLSAKSPSGWLRWITLSDSTMSCSPGTCTYPTMQGVRLF
jgi:hypothetical protein